MRRTTIAIIVTAALAVVAMLVPVTAQARSYSKGCNTAACSKRVCKSASCKARTNGRATAASITASDRAWLYSTRMCESGGNYSINTGNGFYGAYQFTLSSWRAVGGVGMPNNAPPAEQDRRALRLRAMQGTGAWPVCGR